MAYCVKKGNLHFHILDDDMFGKYLVITPKCHNLKSFQEIFAAQKGGFQESVWPFYTYELLEEEDCSLSDPQPHLCFLSPWCKYGPGMNLNNRQSTRLNEHFNDTRNNNIQTK